MTEAARKTVRKLSRSTLARSCCAHPPPTQVSKSESKLLWPNVKRVSMPLFFPRPSASPLLQNTCCHHFPARVWSPKAANEQWLKQKPPQRGRISQRPYFHKCRPRRITRPSSSRPCAVSSTTWAGSRARAAASRSATATASTLRRRGSRRSACRYVPPQTVLIARHKGRRPVPVRHGGQGHRHPRQARTEEEPVHTAVFQRVRPTRCRCVFSFCRRQQQNNRFLPRCGYPHALAERRHGHAAQPEGVSHHAPGDDQGHPQVTHELAKVL